MNLTDALNCYCAKYLKDKNWYQWKLQEKYFHTHFGITLDGTTCFDKTMELKNKLHDLWQRDSTKRTSIIKAYISVWGGIRKNSDETMAKYMQSCPKCLINLGKKGVPSWSKALVIHNPQQYAIFDARVSLSLNCLQELYGIEDKTLYPILGSRNKRVQEGNKKISDISGNWEKPDDSKFYTKYLSMLVSVAEHNHTDISTVEMLLFAKVEAIWRCLKIKCNKKNYNLQTEQLH
ncbi:MAG: hypothetical protein H6Q17_163 [Bacteroidetes bacterium]|nr:hypothetical protein [Bacteroidota bacterium]